MDDKDLTLTENADATEILEAIPEIAEVIPAIVEAIPEIAEAIAVAIQQISRLLIYVLEQVDLSVESVKQWVANLDDEQKALLYEKILSTLHEKE